MSAVIDRHTLRKITVILLGLIPSSNALISAAIPLISKHFEDTIDNIDFWAPLILTSANLGGAVVSPFVGKLVDSWSRRGTILCGLFFFIIAGMAPMLLDNLYLILLSRIMVGIGMSFLRTTAFSLPGYYFDGKERVHTISYQSGASAVGSVLFSGIGGFLASFGWRVGFALFAYPFFLIPMVWMSIYDEPKVYSKETEEVHPSIPTVPLVSIYFSCFCFYCCFYLLPSTVPTLMIDTLGSNSTVTGIFLMVGGIFMGIGSSFIFKRYIAPNFRPNIIYLSAAIGQMITYSWIGHSGTLLSLLIAIAVNGILTGIYLPTIISSIPVIVPKERLGFAMGFFTFVAYMGCFLSPIIITPFRRMISIQMGFTIVSILLSVFTIIVWLLPWWKSTDLKNHFSDQQPTNYDSDIIEDSDQSDINITVISSDPEIVHTCEECTSPSCASEVDSTMEEPEALDFAELHTPSVDIDTDLELSSTEHLTTNDE